MAQPDLAGGLVGGSPDDEAGPGQWLSLAELTARSGAHIDRIRSWCKRASKAGRVHTRKGNDGHVRVWATPELVARLTQDGGSVSPADELPSDQAGLVNGSLAGEAAAELVSELRTSLGEARERAARAESEARHLLGRAAKAETDLAGLAARVEVQERLITTLEAALAEARRPWLARVLEGMRRRGS